MDELFRYLLLLAGSALCLLAILGMAAAGAVIVLRFADYWMGWKDDHPIKDDGKGRR